MSATDSKTISLSDWEDKYSPVSDEASPAVPILPPTEKIWTEIETDGRSFIVPGVAWVNAVGYWVTEKSHNFDIEVEL